MPIPPASLAYRLLRPLLFRLDAERAHELALAWLALVRVPHRVPRVPVDCFGLAFANPLLVAAGLDKDARCVRGLLALGFAGVEVGTVTPRAQPGNDRPRIFRRVADGAVVNRLGFNNRGVDALAARLARLSARTGVVGVNVGKNKDTPNERAVDDYVRAARIAAPHADYVAINVSSPNTPGLRELQSVETLARLLTEVRAVARKPVLVKLAPDLGDAELCELLDAALAHGAAGVILTNTTITPEGGLSGAPLFPLASAKVRVAFRHLRGRMPIVGVGGIAGAEDAWRMLRAGASLVQMYTGLVYGGPALPALIVKGLAERLAGAGVASVVGVDA